jgi:hypothetical protein
MRVARRGAQVRGDTRRNKPAFMSCARWVGRNPRRLLDRSFGGSGFPPGVLTAGWARRSRKNLVRFLAAQGLDALLDLLEVRGSNAQSALPSLLGQAPRTPVLCLCASGSCVRGEFHPSTPC